MLSAVEASQTADREIFRFAQNDTERGLSFYPARQNAVRSVDFCRVQMYWKIGRRIQEEEQKGKGAC